MVCEGKEPLTRPATAGESAVAGHPLPQGEGYISDLGTPGVQPKIWVTISPKGEGCWLQRRLFNRQSARRSGSIANRRSAVSNENLGKKDTCASLSSS